MSPIVTEVLLIVLAVLLGGVIGSIGWAFKLINKTDKGNAVLSSKVSNLESDTHNNELALTSQNNRIVRLETKQEVTDDTLDEIKINVKELSDKTISKVDELKDLLHQSLIKDK
tara:strand:+ start:718 stop:1059 length:342 start_codon:yes stop_codon:yes gene_type:complete